MLSLRRAALAAALATGLSSGDVSADEDSVLWKPVSIGAGGFVTGYVSDRSGATRVIRTDVYGAYRWDAEHDRWVQMVTADAVPAADRVQNGMAEGVFAIAVAPGHAERLYMATRGRVYTSRDRGRSWHLPEIGRPFPMAFDANGPLRHYGPALAVSPVSPGTVYFGSPEDGLWRSVDGGSHWARVPSIPASDMVPGRREAHAPILLWFPQETNDEIWAFSAGHGLYTSHDGTAFAKVVAGGDPGPYAVRRGTFAKDGSFYAIGIRADGTPGAWRLRDGLWRDLVRQDGLDLHRPASGIAALPDGRILIIETGGRVLLSNSSAGAWTTIGRSVSISPEDPPWLRVADKPFFSAGAIVPDPVDPERLWVPHGVGVFEARLGGGRLNLVSRSRGIEELVANDAIHPPGEAPLFAAWDFGVHRMPDPDTYSTGYGPRERVLIAAQQLDWSAGTPSFIVTNASDTLQCCDHDGDAVLAGYSEDGGRSWSKFPTLPVPPGTQVDDPFRMAFGSIAVAADDTDNIVWMPSGDRAPFYSLDRGRTWSRVVFPGETLPSTGSHAAFHMQRKVVSADRVLPGTFYLLHSGGGANAALAGVWRTGDKGQSWQKVFAGDIAPHSQYSAKLRAMPGQAGVLFFTPGVSFGDPGLYRSRDGGENWERLPGLTQVDDVAFGGTPENGALRPIFLSGRLNGNYGIWMSQDDAESWRRIAQFPLGRLDQVTVVAARQEAGAWRVYVGYKGSGWIYGEPAVCDPAPFRQAAASECYRVRAPVPGAP